VVPGLFPASVILSEVGVREADANTVEGPAVCFASEIAMQGILLAQTASRKCLAAMLVRPSSAGALRLCKCFAKRSTYSAQSLP